MNQALSLNYPLQSILTQNSKTNRYILLYIIGLVSLTISSKLSIPLYPVPVTLQTFAVMFIGMIYGARLGTLTVISYIVLGLSGLPILAATTATMTLGYLIGFIPGVYCAGLLVQRGFGKSMWTTALAALIGTILVFVCGLTWLTAVVGFSTAIKVGLMPFILVEVVKITLLALSVPRFWKVKVV